MAKNKRIEESVAIREIEVLDYLQKKWGCTIQYTGMNVFSKVDGFIFKDNELKGILEVKCRRQGLSWMKDYKSVIISYRKLQIGSDLSRLLGVKFFVIIETCDKAIIKFEVTDREGVIVCPMNIRYNELSSTPKFNKKTSTNAYLSLEDNKYCTIYNRNEW
tara:strand:+ start:29 stop:511 length:483 start_codon:yes stop_codon:yes gene_type:complete